MYHRVADEVCDPWALCVSPRLFDQQLDVLRRFAPAVPMSTLTTKLTSGKLPRRSIAITFDDGYADNVETARPLLEQHDVPATFYIVSRHVGSEREFWWDELDRLLLQPGRLPEVFELDLHGDIIRAELGQGRTYDDESYRLNRNWRAWEDPPTPRHALYYALWKRLRPMSPSGRQDVLDALRRWGQADWRARPAREVLSHAALASLAVDSLIEVGCHTMTHPRLASLTIAEQAEEIRGCKESLEKILDRRVASFAYPYGGDGDYTAETVSLVREIGFSSACSTSEGPVTASSDPVQLPRMFVQNWDGDQFASRLAEWFGDR
jgi:peptidoglycan/xylan/chitin deacetylase (PgdA/CDA1 family)